jgi:cobalt transporter subunit CbtA
MAEFRRLVLTALCAGVLAGVLAAAGHQIATVPLILQAEVYEQAAPATHAAAHGAASWAPENGIERAAYTLVADLLAGIGFALLLGAGLSLRGSDAAWRDGLFWGLAGFAAVTLAPGLGLPPELPGSAAAPLAARQLWWAATAIATAGGIALLAFTRRPLGAALAVLLLAAPQVWGAPQPVEHAAAAPVALAQQFRIAATVVSFLFWAALGASTGYFYRRFEPSAG